MSDQSDDRWQPVPVPLGDGRHDVGDAVRAAIAQRLIEDFGRLPDLTPQHVHHLALFAAASVRALLHELGTLRDLATAPVPCAASPADPWQPIETAPKDGTEVLVWTLGSCEAQYHQHIAIYGESEGWRGWASVDGFPTHPTHWMPLPSPPLEDT